MSKEFRENRGKKLTHLILDVVKGGAAPAVAFGALAAVWFFWPIQSIQDQTGFRGSGMVNLTPVEDAAELALLNEVPESEEPYIPEQGDELAGDFYENVQVLGDVSVDNFNRLMAAITEWVSPEQGCAYCHTEDGDLASDDVYAKRVARRMLQMTQNINENWTSHVGDTGVTCWTCHRGQNVPEYHWYTEPRPDAPALIGDNTMLQNRSNETVGYSSLPGDPLTAYLLEDTPIRVQDSVSRTDRYESLQATEWTYGLMFHFSSSLGVNCTYCHNSRSWGSWEQSPPARVPAWYAIRMLRELNNDYMANIDYYPAHRYGSLGDAPKANCATCHQGVSKPMYGASMLGDWPELGKSGKPDYGDGSSASADGTEDRADAGTTAKN